MRLLLALALGLSACGGGSSWDYTPVVQRDGGGLVDAPERLTPEHLDRVEHVFAVYGTPTERVGPTRLRVEGAAPDREMVWNVTTKADDDAWLREHPVP